MSAMLREARRPFEVLVVDDELDNRELLQLVLEWDGFVVRTAASGVEALASVAARLPDVALLDVRMPGMTGFQLAAKLRGDPRTTEVLVVMLTGSTDDGAEMAAGRAGADAFLIKPVGRAELSACLRRLLSSHHRTPTTDAA